LPLDKSLDINYILFHVEASLLVKNPKQSIGLLLCPYRAMEVLLSDFFLILFIISFSGASIISLRNRLSYKFRQSLNSVWWILVSFLLMYMANRPGLVRIQPVATAGWIAGFIGLWFVTKAFFFIEVDSNGVDKANNII
jgi:hypothetical protein